MNQSYWIESSVNRGYSKLNSSEECDCAVIGGGIAGLTTAYLLSKKGKKVKLVDANEIGYGCTGRNTGKITTQHNIIYSKIKKKYGIEKAKNYYDGNKSAVDFIENLIKENEIECEFKRTTSYVFANSDKGMKDLREEFDVCKEIGIDCEFVYELPIPLEVKGAILFNNVAEFNPKMYCDNLGDLIIKEGATIYENSPIVEVEEGAKCTIKTREGKYIQCNQLVLAAHFPFYDGLSFYFARLNPDRSYIVAGYTESTNLEGMYISVDEPRRSIHYINGNGEKLLLIGGENHKVGEGKDINYYDVLKDYGASNFGVSNYKYEWSAEDYITPDYMPYIGALNKSTKNIFVATGFNKWGLTNGTLAGIIISDLIVDGKSEYEETFNPSRMKTYFSTEFLKHNGDVAYRYIKGKLNMGDLDTDIKKGEEKIIFLDGNRYGAYRDNSGELFIVDITCTHLGCELSWNDIEKSWDCPCHGSRFNYEGGILEGPATEPLKRYKDGENKINPKIL
ncbi:FAD-dependent oxidoreductase [Clostridium paraputrificum]|uniref:FAD-dependent oxidoreductase n=1 Tax=Clostridium paraputrificum TaxID=29363 RepID=UPI003D33BCCD